jgi:1,6-anhydro-N-acetylmuramate kinase
MTGTSIDALDGALVCVEGSGLFLRASIVRHISEPLGDIAHSLRSLAQQKPHAVEQICSLSHAFGQLHTRALKRLIQNDRIDLVALHGQTVFHRPPLSWQLIDPTPLAYSLNIPVVFDMRAADLACGGQGAPITPLADFILFRSPSERRAVVNLGGYANFTQLPPTATAEPTDLSDIQGGDIAACNQLLDPIAHLWGDPYDRDGQRAASGHLIQDAYDQLVSFLYHPSADARSLGTGDELTSWIDSWQHKVPHEDLAHTACSAIAEAIVQRVGHADRYILAGGGTFNRTLFQQIRARAASYVSLSDEFGIPVQFREAAEIAVLGALCHDRVPITLPQITKSRSPAPIAGCWIYP